MDSQISGRRGDRVIGWLCGVIVCVLPFAYDRSAYDVLSTKHLAWLLLVVAGVSVALLRDRLAPLTWWGSCLILVGFLSAIWSGESLFWLVPLGQALCLWWWWCLLRDGLPDVHGVGAPLLSHPIPRLWLRAAMLGLVGVAGWIYLLRWSPQSLPWLMKGSLDHAGPMGNPNHLGALLAVGMPLFWVVGSRWSLGVIALVLPLLWTGSRLSLVALAVGLSAAGALLLSRGGTRREGLSVLLLVGFLVIGSFWLSPKKNLRHLTSGWGGLSARVHLVKCAAPMVRDHWWGGVGWGRFRQAFPAYRGRCLKGTKYEKDPRHTIVVNLHNDWLEVLIEGGWVGILLWSFLLWSLLGHLRFSVRLLWRERVWLGVVLVVLGIHMAGHFPLQLPSVLAIAVLAWSLLAWGARGLGSARRGMPWLCRVCLLWGGMILLGMQWQSYRAERIFALADQALDLRAEGALALLQQSEVLFSSSRVALQKGQLLLEKGRPEEAMEALQQAMRWQPDVLVAQVMARALLTLGDTREAIKMIRLGLELRPGYRPLLRMLRRLEDSLPQKKRSRSASLPGAKIPRPTTLPSP